MTHNVSICVRAGLSKPRLVPDTERHKDTKTLDYASTPLDANTLLWAGRLHYSSLNRTASPPIIITIATTTISPRAALADGFPDSFFTGLFLNLTISISPPSTIVNEAIIIVSVLSFITKSIQFATITCPRTHSIICCFLKSNHFCR